MRQTDNIASKFINGAKSVGKHIKDNAIIYGGLPLAGAALIPQNAEALNASFTMDNENNRIGVIMNNDDTGFEYDSVNANIGLYDLANVISGYDPSRTAQDVLDGMTISTRGPPTGGVSSGWNATIDRLTGYVTIDNVGGWGTDAWTSPKDGAYLIGFGPDVYDAQGHAVEFGAGAGIANGIDARTTGGGHFQADSNEWIAINTPISIFSIELQNSITNTIDISVTTEDYYVSDIGRTFQIATCTNLVDAAWTTNTFSYSITNQLTSVMLTNNSDTCFFKLVETK
jgi:hypothetical protein